MGQKKVQIQSPAEAGLQGYRRGCGEVCCISWRETGARLNDWHVDWLNDLLSQSS